MENHDTQRSGGISYRDKAIYRLANVWMLAQPYGYPSIMSSYSFNILTQAGRDAGPPGTLPGPGCVTNLEAVTSPGQWVCEHRDPMIANMVAFRRFVAGSSQANWWDNGLNAIAFSRGNLGFVAINGEATTSVSRVFATGLAAGKYCDVLAGGVSMVTPGTCVGQLITVVSGGNTTLLNLPPLTGLVAQSGVVVP